MLNKTERAIRRVDNDKTGKYDKDIPEKPPLVTRIFDSWFGIKILLDDISHNRRWARYQKLIQQDAQ
jgi:hypothetical protein